MDSTRLTTDELRERVLSNTGSDGRLENETFQLDARAVVILSKRHQISVGRALFTPFRILSWRDCMHLAGATILLHPMES
jgi:hypothetical protein